MHTRDKEASSQFLRILQFPVTRLVILIAIIFYLYISGHIFRAQYAHNPIMNVVVVLWMILMILGFYRIDGLNKSDILIYKYRLNSIPSSENQLLFF